MNFAKTQKAIDLKQRFSVEKWTERTYAPTDADRLLALGELARLSDLLAPCTLHLTGDVNVRQWECNRTFTSLNEALAGGLSQWMLAAYHIERRGLVVKYLPRHDKRLMDEAHEARCELGELDEDEFVVHATEKELELYKTYAKTFLLRGEFQAWFCHSGGDSDVVFSRNNCVQMLTIRNERKYRNVSYAIGRETVAKQRIYA